MHVALIQDDSIVAVGHYSKIFPNTSFGPSGPSAEFLEENNAKLVTNAFAYDPTTHRLEDCPAYLVNDHVSTCLLYTSPSPRDRTRSRMPSSA